MFLSRPGLLVQRPLVVKGIHALSVGVSLLCLALLLGHREALGAQDEGSKVESLLGLSEGLGDEMTIESESLEIRRLADDRRLLVFEKGVFVQQADLSLFADALSAFYGPNDSEPERLEARGELGCQVGILFHLQELDQCAEILPLTRQLLPRLDPALQAIRFVDGLTRLLLIVPEVGRRHDLVEVPQPFFARVEVKDTP